MIRLFRYCIRKHLGDKVVNGWLMEGWWPDANGQMVATGSRLSCVAQAQLGVKFLLQQHTSLINSLITYNTPNGIRYNKYNAAKLGQYKEISIGKQLIRHPKPSTMLIRLSKFPSKTGWVSYNFLSNEILTTSKYP